MWTIKENMKKFAEIGKIQGKNGVNRIFGSKEYGRAAEELAAYMKTLYMESYIDSVGNVHGVYRSKQKSGGEIIIGSHLDTVTEGGMFDGLLGIIAGVECVSRLERENCDLGVDIHVIATNGEEGNELGGTFGSRCLVGEIDTDEEAFREKASKYGMDSVKVEQSRYDFGKTRYYLELHIEQGCFLERQQKKIGVVTGIVGLQRYRIHIKGMSNHSGTTMMEYRKDALVAAARVILFGDETARSYPEHFVATFQTFHVSPCALAIINGDADMILECRCRKREWMERYILAIKAFCETLENVEVEIKPWVTKDPVQTDRHLVEVIEDVCRKKEVPYCLMPSGATHDGNIIAHEVPIGMIFVPSHNGISHSAAEWTDWEDCETGAEVLYQTLLTLGGEYLL